MRAILVIFCILASSLQGMQTLSQMWNSVRHPLEPAIHTAARCNNAARIVELAHNENIDAQNYDGATALHLAVTYGNEDVIDTLINNGASLHKRDYKSLSPLDYAVKNHQPSIAQMLIQRGTDPNARDAYGCTPLYHAIVDNNIDMTHLLLANYASPNTQIGTNTTPLHIACEQPHISSTIVHCLAAYEADVNARGTYNETPLHHTAQHGDMTKTQILITYFANVNAQDENGITPLSIAATYKNHDHITQLIQFGGDIQQPFSNLEDEAQYITSVQMQNSNEIETATMSLGEGSYADAVDIATSNQSNLKTRSTIALHALILHAYYTYLPQGSQSHDVKLNLQGVLSSIHAYDNSDFMSYGVLHALQYKIKNEPISPTIVNYIAAQYPHYVGLYRHPQDGNFLSHTLMQKPYHESSIMYVSPFVCAQRGHTPENLKRETPEDVARTSHLTENITAYRSAIQSNSM